jgi:hypothetical protein
LRPSLLSYLLAFKSPPFRSGRRISPFTRQECGKPGAAALEFPNALLESNDLCPQAVASGPGVAFVLSGAIRAHSFGVR